MIRTDGRFLADLVFYTQQEQEIARIECLVYHEYNTLWIERIMGYNGFRSLTADYIGKPFEKVNLWVNFDAPQ